jgi:hypothetical protein
VTITVIGQKGDGPVLQRTVTLLEFIEGWGPYAMLLWNQAQDKTIVIDGHKIRVIVR